jgi:hypothetical protein
MTAVHQRLFDDVDESIRDIKVIAVDTRLTEPADLWTSRAPEDYVDRVPRVLRAGNFPHPTCLYPEPLRHIAPTLRDVEPSFRQKVRGTNAARVYNIDLDRL